MTDPTDDAFRRSYKDFASYPINLIFPYGNPAALEDYRARLDAAGHSLFNSNPNDICVAFREFDAIGTVTKQNIFSDLELAEWLGDREKMIVDHDDLVASRPLPPNRHREPKCRFVFVLANHSWNPLNITRGMFSRILSYHQVNPNYVNFCLCFGLEKNRPRDFRFSGFRAQSFLTNPSQELDIPFRGRSGLHFQLSYNLRAIELSSQPGAPPKDMTWARRQIAVHHQFDIVYGTSVWIVTSGRDTIKQRIQKLLPGTSPDLDTSKGHKFATQADCLKTSLTVHSENCFWSVTQWRWYMQWLEERLEDLTESAIDQDILSFSEVDLRMLQSYEDRVNEAIMILQTNSEVLASIVSFYQDLMGELSLPWMSGCQDAIFQFTSQIKEMMCDLKMHVYRGEVLIKISDDRKKLLHQRIQAQGNRETAALTARMQKVSEENQKEAVAVRIITVITLIFLPATFVSTLFSTDIVGFDGRKEVYSSLALERWIEVTIPLTISTLVLALVWNYYHHFRERVWRKGDIRSETSREKSTLGRREAV